ncbi:MAG: endonuclease MutS2 [Clostridia bacterium]|nr:endonuclease MutS2 [Clostridia bacterium]
MNKHETALELHKILERLATFAAAPDAKEMILALEPTSDLEDAEHLLQKTADAHMLMARFGAPSFGGLRNVNNALSRADAGSVLTMRELLDVAGVLKTIRGICDWRNKCSGVKCSLDVFFDALTPNRYLEDKILSAIVSEDEMSDNASPALADIRKKIRIASSRVRDQLDRLLRSPQMQKYLREAIVTMRNGRYVVPVKIEHRKDVHGLVHDTSSSGATVFIEPAAVVEANNDIKLLQSKEHDEMERILAELSAEAGSFYEGTKASYECALELDVIFAKAKMAYDMNAGAPKLNDFGKIDPHAARHPLIDPKKVVATDIRLGTDFDTLIITGPNTGGKTVSIKTLGLLTLMAMCGLMLPAGDRSEISVFDHVLADIGDEQSIEQSLSTFSSHMTNIIDILSVADSRSLVLIDELGAGTDPVEGAALAMAILERLHEKGAKIAATTHYAELKKYALETPGIENGSCEFDVQSLRPTYRLLIGVPGRSNAFAISARLGMEDAVIARAKQLVSDEESGFEHVIESLEQSRMAYETKRQEAEALQSQATKVRDEARQYKDSIEALRTAELEKARAQAQQIIDRAKRSAWALTSELEELKKESAKSQDKAELARRARQLMKQSLGEFDDITNPVTPPDPDEDYVLPRPLRVGDTVLLVDIGKTGEVTALADKRGDIEVTAGILKMRTPLKNLRLQDKPQPQKTTRTAPKSGGKDFRPEGGKAECDIRGMTVEDGILELERHMDRCMRQGLSEITVIHGKGTGALRKGIQDYLRRCKYVKSYRLGTFGEGEAGVTVVTLK